jgi:hypothetical protein
VIWPAPGLVLLLVTLVRPAVAVVATARASLTRNDRIFVGFMDLAESSGSCKPMGGLHDEAEGL